MVFPWWFNVFFFALAFFFSFFYTTSCFKIFSVDTTNRPCHWWLHQIWFNLLGSICGWIASWFLIRNAWLCLTSGKQANPGLGDLLLFLLAFTGITGHLPHAMFGLFEGSKELFLRVLGQIGKK